MNAELADLIGKFPTPGGDRKLANPDKEAMDQAVAELVKRGRDAVVGLVDSLVDPSVATDTPVRHALHALATYVAGHKDENVRREIAGALGSTLNGKRPKEAKAFVIRQLQVCGGSEVADALVKELPDEDLCADAANTLLAIGTSSHVFRAALAVAEAKRHRLTLIQSIGVLGEAEARDLLRAGARDDDGEIRQASLWGLANTGHPDDAEMMIKAASAKGYERVQATNSCLVWAEKLLATGHQEIAAKIYRHLRESRSESESYVREAAQRGLAASSSRSLFNGKDFTGWQDASGKPAAGWTIEDGAMVRKAQSGDIWTIDRFGDFVLELEFKTTGNSGVFIRTEKPADNVQTGIEIQIDNPSKPGKHSCGAVYDCLAPRTEAARRNQWNQVVITAKNSRITVAMNGEPIIDMDLDQWTEPNKNPDGSKNKFRTPLKDFKREGHIGLQDHGAVVAYRHIKLRPLTSSAK